MRNYSQSLYLAFYSVLFVSLAGGQPVEDLVKTDKDFYNDAQCLEALRSGGIEAQPNY